MKLENPKTPKLDASPKIHKQGNPGRTAVNSVNYQTSYLSKFVDHYLQPHVQNLPSYVKDTPDFIKKLRDIQEETGDTILLSMDVKCPYTNTSNHEGKEAVKVKQLKLNAQTGKPIATKVVIKFLIPILTLITSFQQHQLSPNKRLHNGNQLHTIICEYLYGKFESKCIYPYIREKTIT